MLTMLMGCWYLLSVCSLQGGVEDIACTGGKEIVLLLQVLISAAGVVCVQ